ncbi:MAG: hypothetical protein ACHQJ4_04590 [Ignavibacteria bacterium]
MIKDIKAWEEFERNLIADTKPDFKKNLRIYQQMLNLAIKFKALPLKNPLEGIEVDLRIARVLNGIK